MEELIQVLKEMNTINWLDIVAIITPIILSVIAIVISICTMKKQNKIALLEKRLEIVNEIEKIQSFYLDMSIQSKIIKEVRITPDKLILICDLSLKYDENFKQFETQGGEKQYLSLYKRIQVIREISCKSNILFKSVDSEDLFQTYIDIILDVYDDEENIQEKINEFVTVGKSFFDEKFEKMKSQLKL